MFSMQMLSRDHPQLSEVTVTVVDNYQGQENNIVILSLVRSSSGSDHGIGCAIHFCFT